MQSELAAFSDAVRLSTIKRLRRVPAGAENWRPDEGAMSFADVAQHLVACDASLSRAVAEGPQPVIHGGLGGDRTRAAFLGLIDDLVRSGAARRALISSIADWHTPAFDERFGNTTIWWVVVRGNLDHEIHHRGQIAAYLRTVELS